MRRGLAEAFALVGLAKSVTAGSEVGPPVPVDKKTCENVHSFGVAAEEKDCGETAHSEDQKRNGDRMFVDSLAYDHVVPAIVVSLLVGMLDILVSNPTLVWSQCLGFVPES